MTAKLKNKIIFVAICHNLFLYKIKKEVRKNENNNAKTT